MKLLGHGRGGGGGMLELVNSGSIPSTTVVGIFDLYISTNGKKMYATTSRISSQTNQQRIYEYDITTDYDVTTISYVRDINIPTILTNVTQITGINIKDDGQYLYALAIESSTYLYKYQMSPAYSIASLTYIDSSSSQPGSIHMDVARDGRSHISIKNSSAVMTYIDTASWGGDGVWSDIALSSISTSAKGIAFSSDGSKIYILEYDGSWVIKEFILGTINDPSSIIDVVNREYDLVLDGSIDPRSISIVYDTISGEEYLYVINTSDSSLRQYIITQA